MAKTVSTAFLTAWRNKGCKFAVQKINYKRRYFNGAAMVYEANWQSLTMPGAQFASIGSMSFGLSAIFNAEFTTSNAMVRLLNSDYRWTPENPAGIFGADAVTASGYFPRGTMVQIYSGLELAGGTFELLSMFSGLLVDYTSKPMEGIFEAYISGYEEYAKNGDAETISDAFTNEALTPVPDGTNKDFRTTSTGVGYVTKIRDATVTKSEGVDYTISELDGPLGAKVSFVVAPIAGHALDASGLKWKLNQLLDVLAGLACDASGITAGNRAISPILISGGASGSKTIDTKADWEAGGVLTNIATTTVPGDISRKWFLIDDFTDADFTAAPVWTKRTQVDLAPAVSSASAASGAMVLSHTTPAQQAWIDYDTPLPAVLPRAWRFAFTSNSTFTGDGNLSYAHFMRSVADINSNGYAIVCDWNTNAFYLARIDGGGIVTLINVGAADAVSHIWLVTRDDNGLFTVYKDSVNQGSVTDATYASAGYFGVANRCLQSPASAAAGRFITTTIDAIAISYSIETSDTYTNAAAVFESAVQDIFSIPSAWGTLDRTDALNGGAITYATAVSADGFAWDAYVDISAAGVIQSALKRYFKVRALPVPAAGSFVSPSVSKLVANFSTTTVNLTVASFKGMGCYTVLQKLAFICNYEIGFDCNGIFFFRSRTNIAAPFLSFNQTDILAKVLEIKPGWNEVLNDVTIGYGSAYKKYNSASLPETAPTSVDKYFKRLANESIDFVLSNDVNLAQGLAQAIHDEWYLAKRRVLFECRLIPHAEPGDIMTISFYEDPLDQYNYYGDPLRNSWAPVFGSPAVALRDFKCRIIELTHDFDTNISRILGLEVLT